MDKLTKYTTTHNELSQEGLARFFVEQVADVFGLPTHAPNPSPPEPPSSPTRNVSDASEAYDVETIFTGLQGGKGQPQDVTGALAGIRTVGGLLVYGCAARPRC